MKKKRLSGEWGPKDPSNGFKGRKHSDETKKKLSENNGATLSEDVIQFRINTWNSIPDGRGKIMKMCKLWNVSHTQVRRFIKNLGVA